MEIKRITPEQAKELLDTNQGYMYLDVRTVPEFEAGHVPGAKNLPVVEPDASGRMQLNPRFVEIVEANFGKDVKCITNDSIRAPLRGFLLSFPSLLNSVLHL